jgi:ankyrin repeat protein
VQAGADRTIRSKQGLTPLDMAKANKQQALIALLEA